MPESVFINHLAKVTDAYLLGDITGLRAIYDLPLQMEARTGTYIVATEEDFERDFSLYRELLALQQVTDVIRQVNAVTQPDANTMLGTYTSHIMRRAERIVDPYTSVMTLRRDTNGNWRTTKVANAIGHTHWS